MNIAELVNKANEIFRRSREIEAEGWDLHYKACEELAKKHGVDEIEIGSWKCKDSEINVCYYDINEDPCRDHCLVCENPSERK